MIGKEIMKPVQYLDNGTRVRCLCCNQIFTLEELDQHIDEFCFPSYQISGEKKTAYRIELLKREPCWECSHSLCNIKGKVKPPYVAYIAKIMGHERKLHRRCAEGLGYKCVMLK